MWSFIAQPLSKFWGKMLLIALPWLRRLLFSSVVKQAGSGALKKAPLGFHAPNLIVTFFSIIVINGINFVITLWFSDDILVSLISTGSVTAVTAFFLLRGFFCPHTKKERVILLSVLLVFFGLFVFFRVVIDIPWLALVLKLTLEVIFCFAVMLSELHRLNKAQGKAIDAAMRTFKISPEGFIGKWIIKVFAPKNSEDSKDNEDSEDGDKIETL